MSRCLRNFGRQSDTMHDNAVERGFIPELNASNRFDEQPVWRDACIRRETFRS